jgi:hypothetical protein
MLPSGDQLGSSWSIVSSVSARRSLPSGPIEYSSWSLEEWLVS